MKKLFKSGLLFSFMLPYLISFAPLPPDSSPTTIEIAAGYGSYSDVTRDCNGRVVSVTDVPYSDYGVSISHEVSVVQFGVAGGLTSRTRSSLWHGNSQHTDSEPIPYAIPTVGLNTCYFGLDAGILFPLNGHDSQSFFNSRFPGIPSTKLRVGRLDAFYFSMSFARNVPLLAGGGLADAGFGFNLGRPNSSGWIGIGVFPYDGLVLSTKWEFPVSETFLITPKVQLGGRESFEFGLAIGGKFRLN